MCLRLSEGEGCVRTCVLLRGGGNESVCVNLCVCVCVCVSVCV